MKEQRRLVRQERLQKFVRLLSGRYNINVHLPEEKQELFQKKFDRPAYFGFCDTKSNIYIHPKIDSKPYENLIKQKAIALHELGHVLYTDGDLWQKSGVSHGLCNIIEDGRVEEAMSRKYPKARKYFFYLYSKISFPKRKLSLAPLKIQTLEFLLRTAKSTTGMPPLPENVKNKLKKKLKDDYYWLGSKTRKAVFVDTEQEAIKITKEIENKLVELFSKDKKSYFPNVARTPYESISAKRNKKGQPHQMPPMRNDPISKQILEQEQKEFNKQKEQKNEKSKTSNAVKQLTKEMDNDAKKELEKETGKNVNDIYNDIVKKTKEEIEKDAKKEYKVETNEVKTGKSNANFNTYDVNSKKNYFEGEAIHTAPLEPIAHRIVHNFKLIAQKGRGWKHNQLRGKIDSPYLYRVYSSKSNPRVFKNQKPKEKTDLSAVILLDASSSMCGIRDVATKATYVIARALEIGNFNVEVVAFGVKDTDYPNDLYGLKSFNQTLQYAKHRFVPKAIDGTPLYPGLVGAQKSLEKMNSKRKIIIVITDGEPNEGGGTYECKNKIKEIEKGGISVIGILISTKDYNNLFLSSNRLSCNDVYELPIKMTDVIKNVLLTIKR